MKIARSKAPKTMATFMSEEGAIKRSTIVVLNEKIINKNKLEEVKIADTDIIEIFMQFAGG